MYYNLFILSFKSNILEWIKNDKKFETRARRIKEIVDKAAKNIRLIIKTFQL